MTTDHDVIDVDTEEIDGGIGTLFAYAGWKSGPLAVSLGGDLGWGDMHIARAVSALSETESSSRHGTTGEVFAQASYDIDLATALVSPYVALDHVSAGTDAFSEAGGGADEEARRMEHVARRAPVGEQRRRRRPRAPTSASAGCRPPHPGGGSCRSSRR